MIGNLITLAADTVAVLAAFTFGSRFANRRKDRPKPKNLICGCGHELAHHDPATRHCHRMVEVGHHEAYGKSGGTRWVSEPQQCSCRVYTGDLPDDWYARIITGNEAA